MPRRSPDADMRSPTDEACLHEDTYRPSTQAESDARYAAFKARQAEVAQLHPLFAHILKSFTAPTLLTTAKAGERAA